MELEVNLKIKTTEIVGGKEPDRHYYLILSGDGIVGSIRLNHRPDIVPGENLILSINNPQITLNNVTNQNTVGAYNVAIGTTTTMENKLNTLTVDEVEKVYEILNEPNTNVIEIKPVFIEEQVTNPIVPVIIPTIIPTIVPTTIEILNEVKPEENINAVQKPKRKYVRKDKLTENTPENVEVTTKVEVKIPDELNELLDETEKSFD